MGTYSTYSKIKYIQQIYILLLENAEMFSENWQWLMSYEENTLRTALATSKGLIKSYISIIISGCWLKKNGILHFDFWTEVAALFLTLWCVVPISHVWCKTIHLSGHVCALYKTELKMLWWWNIRIRNVSSILIVVSESWTNYASEFLSQKSWRYIFRRLLKNVTFESEAALAMSTPFDIKTEPSPLIGKTGGGNICVSLSMVLALARWFG